jgi:S-phase kinase-associated protein 1
MDLDKKDYFILTSKEGKEITVSKTAGRMSKLLTGAEKDFEGDVINLPIEDFEEKIILLIVAYLEHWQGESPSEIEKPLKSKHMKENTDEWSAEFIDGLNLVEIADLAVAANFMEINPLLELACAKIASLGKDKSDEELFSEYGIDPGLYTESEKEKIRLEHKWLEEDVDNNI